MKRSLEVSVFYCKLFLMLIWFVVVSVAAIPLGLIRWKNTSNNFLFALVYSWGANHIMGFHVDVVGREHLRIQPAVFVANHQSVIDLATIGNLAPSGAVVVGKKEIRYIPFFGIMFESFGNVMIDRKDRVNALTGLNAAVGVIKRKKLSVWIFPEGTRNASGEGLLPFKKGAFYMAIQAQVPIVPVICSKLGVLVDFTKKYAHSGRLTVKVLPPIPTLGLTNSDVTKLLNQTRDAMLAAVAEINPKA